MNTIPNRQIICDALISAAARDRDVVVLCSDSRGSASLSAFAERFPAQFIEVGIAEQNLVSIAAGLAACGKKTFAASPACFLSSRSLEQVKVDVAYSERNVKLIGISGGVSYGALGMTHHSAGDVAAIAAIPNLRVYLPSDRVQTKFLMEELLRDTQPAYIRVGRNSVPDVYKEGFHFTPDRAAQLRAGIDVTIIACGEMVSAAFAAGESLARKGLSARVLDMFCLKPIDDAAVIAAATETKAIVTVEEHSRFGGLGAMVSQIVAETHPVRVRNLTLPDCPVIAGTSKEVFDHYGLNAEGIEFAVMELLSHV